MPKDNNTPAPNGEDNNNSSFDLYSEDKTKEIVGSLFDEFVEDGDTNYFADYSDPFLDSEASEEEESLKDSISRRRRRNITASNKSIVFRKKTKKVKSEEPEPDEDNYKDEEAENNTVKDPSDLEKTIILPKLSNFFKKSEDYKDYDNEDDEIDEFFASLTKDSVARAHGAAASEEDNLPAEETAEKAMTNRRYKKIQIEDAYEEPPHSKKSRQEVIEPVQEDTDDEYEEKLVEISIIRIITAAVLIIAVVVITALAYKNHSYAKQLEEARSQITELQKNSSSTYETELNELKNQVSELTAENESLKANTSSESDPHAAAVEILNEAQSEISSQESPNTSLSQDESGGNTYTVKAGDTFWKISQSVYGNGANYQKILDANNLTENSVLNEGQVLTIPN